VSLSRESDERAREALEIPYRELSSDALRGVIEAFVLREGTDYGETHHSLEDKVQQVLRQLERKEARIVFDPNTESVDIVVTVTLRRRGGE
jgi:hypothetical protein